MRYNLKIFICCILISLFLPSNSQEPISIKVRKEQNLVKAYFNNVDLKLNAIDRFGNPKENKIVSYKLWIKGNGNKFIEGFDNNLTNEMLKELNKQKKASKIFFTEINVQDDEGHLVKLPDLIETWFPDCKNCDTSKKRKN